MTRRLKDMGSGTKATDRFDINGDGVADNFDDLDAQYAAERGAAGALQSLAVFFFALARLVVAVRIYQTMRRMLLPLR